MNREEAEAEAGAPAIKDEISQVSQAALNGVKAMHLVVSLRQ